jgi:hypothetical protein
MFFLDSLKDHPDFDLIYLRNSYLKGYILWYTSQKEQAREILLKNTDSLEELVKNYTPIYHPVELPLVIALIKNYALLGHKKDVYRLLNDYEKKGITQCIDLYFTHDPAFSLIWEDQEFKDFLERQVEKRKKFLDETRKLREDGLII